MVHVTFKFLGWPWKTIGHLFCTTSSFVHHFKPVGEFNLQLQSRNAQFGSNWRFSVLCDLEIWWMTLTKIGHLFYATSSFVNHYKAIGEFKLEWQSGNAQFHSKSTIFVPCDLEISQMTLKKEPLLCYFKIWASFHSHLWIRTGVTVPKKIPNLGQNRYLFLALWPWNVTDNLEKKIGHLFSATSTSMHNFIAISEFKLEIQSGYAQFGSKSTIFLAVWPWNLTDDLENQ